MEFDYLMHFKINKGLPAITIHWMKNHVASQAQRKRPAD